VGKSGLDKGRVDKGGPSSSTGLGLAIVKRILDLHGSRIKVTSEPGRGTRFEFNLPRVQRSRAGTACSP
jgi:signal transduction histidine kinase